MKKSKLILGIALSAMLGASSLFLTSCGNTADIENVTEKLDAVVSSIKTNDSFTSKTLSVSGKNYQYYAPKYESNIQTRINAGIFTQDTATDLNKLGLIYDYTFGYSFKIIQDNLNIMKNSEVKKDLSSNAQKSISNLDKTLNSYAKQIKGQERALKNASLYVASVADLSEIMKNALYNYQKDYSAFVDATINLATISSDVVSEAYNINYKESNSATFIEDEIMEFHKFKNLNEGDNVIVEEVYGKFITVKYIDEYLNFYRGIINIGWLDVPDGEELSLDQEVAINGNNLSIIYRGKLVKKGSQVKVIKDDTSQYTVEFVDNRKVHQQTFAKTGDSKTEAVTGKIELNSIVKISKDVLFEDSLSEGIKGRLQKNTQVKVVDLDLNYGTFDIEYIDSDNLVYTAKVSQEVFVEKEIQKDDIVRLKQDCDVKIQGKKVSKNTVVKIYESGDENCTVKYIDKNIEWRKTVSVDKINQNEPLLFDKINLETIKDYYAILSKSLDAKNLTQKEITDTESTVDGEKEYIYFLENTVLNNYKTFIKNTFVQRDSIAKGVIGTSIEDLEEKFSAFMQERKVQRERLDNFNMHGFRFKKEFKTENLSKQEKINLKAIRTFYTDTLTTWTNYYFDTI